MRHPTAFEMAQVLLVDRLAYQVFFSYTKRYSAFFRNQYVYAQATG